MTILSVLATITGTLLGAANLPQAYKIFKKKSAKDISILTYSILLIGGIIWILYGLEIKNSPVIVLNSMASLSFILVLIGWFIYGREKNEK